MVNREVDWPVWLVLGRFWGLCVRSWASLGAYVGGLGTYVGDLELLLGLYGRSWAALGASIGGLGCTWAALGAYVGDLWLVLGLYCLPLLPRRPCNNSRGKTSTLLFASHPYPRTHAHARKNEGAQPALLSLKRPKTTL